MNNQEKMQNIYDLTGVEPRMWLASDPSDYNILIDRKDMVEGYKYHKPHYPESQLWEMLRPVVDIVSWDMYFIVLQYRKNNQGELKQIQFSVTDLHTALLDMVLWCCENGYIKILEEKE